MADLADLNPKQECLVAFADTLHQFLTNALEVWPQDPVLASHLAGLEGAMAKGPNAVRPLIQGFNAALAKHVKQIDEKDATVFSLDVPELVELAAAAKFAGASTDVQEVVWAYMQQLAQCGRSYGMFKHFPDSMVQSMTAMTAKLQSGGMDATTMDPTTLAQHMNFADVVKFSESLMNDPDAMASVAEMMEAVMSNPETAGMLGGAGGLLGGMLGGGSGSGAGMGGMLSGLLGGGMGGGIGGIPDLSNLSLTDSSSSSGSSNASASASAEAQSQPQEGTASASKIRSWRKKH